MASLGGKPKAAALVLIRRKKLTIKFGLWEPNPLVASIAAHRARSRRGCGFKLEALSLGVQLGGNILQPGSINLVGRDFGPIAAMDS